MAKLAADKFPIPDITVNRRIFARNRKIAELCKAGFNGAQISRFIGLTRARVCQILRELELQPVPRKLTVSCETCQKSFTKFRSLIVAKRQHFCSVECRNKGRQAALAKFSCHVCGTPVHRPPSRRAVIRRVFCSQKCYYSVRQDGKYKPSRQGQRRAREIVSKYFPLTSQNVVHHEDKDNRNNALENLRVFATNADHMAYHHGNPEAVPIWDGRTVQP